MNNLLELSNEQLTTSLSKMILSASGWRTVFALSGEEQDSTNKISVGFSGISLLIGKSFCDWFSKEFPQVEKPRIALACDTRPTGKTIADFVLRSVISCGFDIRYVGVASAPEVMAYARKLDGFIYISASHNPIGHNGIKFGLNDGGVIDGEKSKVLIENFKSLCNQSDASEIAKKLFSSCSQNLLDEVYKKTDFYKKECLQSYSEFFYEITAASTDKNIQSEIFSSIKKSIQENPISVACDLNGSARCLSIDSQIFAQNDIPFFTINNEAFKIAHEIIPEPENLVYCADFMKKLHSEGNSNVKLGYMPDCDGDRGNIVYWSDDNQPKILKAQEVFSLSVLSELAFMDYLADKFPQFQTEKKAISVNDPTSMRIEEIATCFGAKVCRAEVGEANVVNLARNLRQDGYQVRILGEGSNGGTITNPAAVRDPINTIFALLKLLCLKDEVLPNGKVVLGLFHRWCKYSGNESFYKEDFSLDDVAKTLPLYVTTGVSESRAILHIQTSDHSELKSKYQKNFENFWQEKKEYLKEKYNIFSYQAVCNNGTKQTDNLTDFSVSAKGGLKVIFYNEEKNPIAFIWMRGSGTESAFRVMCDVKVLENSESSIDDAISFEKELLEFHSDLIKLSDK
ncbi:MAG: phosphoglucomutase [Treponemataceae bacterium]|nr:phosphoglucomutase [Treponemataceae bacterium]